MKDFLKNLSIAVVSLLVTFGTLEFTLRVFRPSGWKTTPMTAFEKDPVMKQVGQVDLPYERSRISTKEVGFTWLTRYINLHPDIHSKVI